LTCLFINGLWDASSQFIRCGNMQCFQHNHFITRHTQDIHQTRKPSLPFTHGNQGLGMQSFSLTEHLASHGFVVVAPNHEGNTIFDSPSDEEVAQISLDRPLDIVYAMQQIISSNAQPENDFFEAIDLEAIGISGHSFGGYTTILLAGADVDVSAAQARCDAGTPGDIFCPYLTYWDSEENIKRPAGANVFKAALALAHGGYAAFGDEGMAKVDMPVMLMGGSLDDFTFNELRPTYDALPLPKYKIEIERAGHMSFTDICRADLPVPDLEELCDPEVFLDIDRAFFIINVYATAYFRYYLKDDQPMAAYLGPDYAAELVEVSFEAQED